jgi:hypothetical protein
MKSPVAISEKEVDRGMLKPVTRASAHVTRSSGLPIVKPAAGTDGLADCEPNDKGETLGNGRVYREIAGRSQSQSAMQTPLDHSLETGEDKRLSYRHPVRIYPRVSA